MKLKSVGFGMKTVEARKRVPLTSGKGFTTAHDGYKTAELEVLVDVEALLGAIGVKALLSKKGISKLQGGSVTVRVKGPIRHDLPKAAHGR